MNIASVYWEECVGQGATSTVKGILVTVLTLHESYVDVYSTRVHLFER